MRFRSCLLLSVVACLAPVLGAKEPANLDLLKQEIRRYIDSGEYEKEIATVAAEAKAWLTKRAETREGKLAIVFDLDETLISNLPEFTRIDLGRDRKALAEWFEAAKCPPIESVRELYQLARKLEISVLFITGRPARYRAATEKNLQTVGCGEFAALVCKPDGWKDTTEKYKTAERQRLTAEGYIIVANIGDQESDLAGGYAEKTFKLPNPIYLSK